MPLLNGLEATRQILKAFPATKVLILSAHSDDAYVEQATESGARDFCSNKPPPTMWPGRFAKSKKETHFSALPFPSAFKGRDQKSLDRGEQFKKKGNRLSSREVEVLQLIAEGKANKQVAAELGVSFKTVDKHRQHLMEKLDIHDIAGLTRYAIAEGIIESSVQLTIMLRSGVFSAGRDAPALRQAGRPPLRCLARPRGFPTDSLIRCPFPPNAGQPKIKGKLKSRDRTLRFRFNGADRRASKTVPSWEGSGVGSFIYSATVLTTISVRARICCFAPAFLRASGFAHLHSDLPCRGWIHEISDGGNTP